VPELLHEAPDVDTLRSNQTEVQRRLQPAADEDRAADGAGQRAVYVGFGSDGRRILTIRVLALSKGLKAVDRCHEEFAYCAPFVMSCLQGSGIMELMERDTTDKRLDRLEARVDHGFELVDQRFEAVDQRFEAVDQRFAQVDQRFAQVDQRFEEVGHRFDRVELAIDNLRNETKSGFDSVNERFERMYRVMIWFCGLAMATLIGAVASLLATQI
jgi:chromosome segregation ATPase